LQVLYRFRYARVKEVRSAGSEGPTFGTNPLALLGEFLRLCVDIIAFLYRHGVDVFAQAASLLSAPRFMQIAFRRTEGILASYLEEGTGRLL
jgi:hypothetical protein